MNNNDFFNSAVSKANSTYGYLNSYEYDALMKGAKYGDYKQQQEARDALATAKQNDNKAFGGISYRDPEEDYYAKMGRPRY